MGPDVVRIFWGRGIRGFADGFVSVLLAGYLTALDFSPIQVGAIVTGTLIGSATLTLTLGLTAHRLPLRSLLLGATALMFATGVGFATVTWFWLLLVVAVVGTLNPSSGDVSVFLPTEQAFIADEVAAPERPRVYARYNLTALYAGAAGALLSALPDVAARRYDWDVANTYRAAFSLYIAAAVAIFLIYRGLPRAPETDAPISRSPLQKSRRTVLELAALFSLDAASGGLVVTSLLVLWFHLKFDLSPATTGAVFFAVSLLSGTSQLVAPVIARRFGLIRTMVFTHLPASLLLILMAFAPNAGIAIALLFARSFLSQMDVPVRQSFVMAVVPPQERAAAASVTNVPRSIAAATTPLFAGWLLSQSDFGWPLVIAGSARVVYNVALLMLYRNVPEEEGARRERATRAP